MLSVKDQRRLNAIKKKQHAKVFNPTDEDFTVKYNGKDYTLSAGNSVVLPVNIAEHIAKHLTNKRLGSRNLSTNSPKREQFLKEVIKYEQES